MNNRSGSIEILLLLGCLVGVVAFFSLTLAVSSVFSQQPHSTNVSDLEKERENLLEKKQQKETVLGDLKKELEQLLEKRKELEEKIFQSAAPSPGEKQKLEQILKQYQQEYRLLEERIKKIRADLNELVKLPDPAQREEIEKEIKGLESKLSKMQERIDEVMKDLAKFKDGNLGVEKDEKKRIRADLEEAQLRKKEIKKEISRLKIKFLTAGTTQFKNPLYVDCKRDFYVVYPGGKVIQTSELKKSNVFKELAVGHDIIVLYVRPEGFKSFREAFARVKAIATAHNYEPIEADQKLDMLKGIDR